MYIRSFKFQHWFFLALDNEDKRPSKRCAITLVSLLFLLSSISKSSLIKNDILVNDKIVSDDKDFSESFNDVYANIGTTLAAEPTKRSSNNVNTYLSNIQNNFPAFRFSNTPVKNVTLTLKKTKSFKFRKALALIRFLPRSLKLRLV